MTRDDIIRMAIKAGLLPSAEIYEDDLERFAALVAAAELDSLPIEDEDMTVIVERSACELRRLAAEHDQLRAEVNRLEGEACVMREILGDADEILAVIEPMLDESGEAEPMRLLRQAIAAALSPVRDDQQLFEGKK